MSADAAPLRWEDLTAVDAAWSVARGRLPDFERWVGGPFREALVSRAGEGRVLAFLPVSHKPRRRTREAPSWSYWMLVLAAPGADAPELADTIAGLAGDSGADLRSVGRARPQPSLDMVYPVDGPARERRLLQSIEYVFSKPAERPDYYRSQYEFSGPAMRRLHQRDRAGRFLGVEITERLHGDVAMPLWDVVHVSGFTVAQTLRPPAPLRQGVPGLRDGARRADRTGPDEPLDPAAGQDAAPCPAEHGRHDHRAGTRPVASWRGTKRRTRRAVVPESAATTCPPATGPRFAPRPSRSAANFSSGVRAGGAWRSSRRSPSRKRWRIPTASPAAPKRRRCWTRP